MSSFKKDYDMSLFNVNETNNETEERENTLKGKPLQINNSNDDIKGRHNGKGKQKDKKGKSPINIYNQIVEKVKKNLNKDLALKLLSKKLLESAGYFTILEANIYKPSYIAGFKHDQVTDIDVLGIRFDIDLSHNILAVECKSGNENSLDELLKLKGIMDYIEATRGYFVKSKVSNNARELGYKLKISTFDQSEIESLVVSHLANDQKLSEWLIAERENYIREKSVLEYANMQIPVAVKYLNRDLWNNTDSMNLQNLCILIRRFRDTDMSDKYEIKNLFLQLSLAFSIFMLKLCGYALSKNLNFSKECFIEAFFGGPKEKREKEVLFDKINQLIASEGRPLSSFSPDYLDIIVDLAFLLLKNPLHTKEVIKCLDFYCKASILKFEGYNFDELDKNYSSITLKLAKDVITTTCKLANQNVSIFHDLFHK